MKLLSIPPRWPNIIGGILVCGYSIFLIYYEFDAPYPAITPDMCLVVMLVYIAFSFVSYDIDEQYLVTKYCGIPISRTPWKIITCAVYLPEIKHKRRSCIVLSKMSGSPYIPTKNEVFLRRSLFTTIRINLYEPEVEECILVITPLVGGVCQVD